MGADLYLRSVFDKQYRKTRPLFDEAVKERDKHERGTPEREAAQREVERRWEEMYARGYFRDSYNSSNLLWKFGLSWWADVIPLLDDGRLSPENAGKLSDMLRERAPDFYKNLADCTPKKENWHFRQKYVELQLVLGLAVERQEPIECSL